MNLLTALNTLLLLIAPVNTQEAEIEQSGFQIQVYPYGGYYNYPPCPDGYSYYNGYCYPYGGYYFYYGPGYRRGWYGHRYYGKGRGHRHGRGWGGRGGRGRGRGGRGGRGRR